MINYFFFEDCLVAIRENMHIKEINKASANVAGSNYS